MIEGAEKWGNKTPRACPVFFKISNYLFRDGLCYEVAAGSVPDLLAVTTLDFPCFFIAC